MPSIDSQIRTCHETARVTQQKHSRSAVLFRVAQTLEHVGIWPCRLPLWEGLKQACGHGSDDVSRREGVDSDAMFTPLGRKVSAQLDHGCLGSVVRPVMKLVV